MIIFIHFLIAFTASVVGAISGIGGGIIIKPVLDTFGLFDIEVINFLSGCTVLSMTTIALIRSRTNDSNVSIHGKIGGLLAVSGVFGGILGKYLFNLLIANVAEVKVVQSVQAAILLVLTLGVLIFTLYKRKFTPRHFSNAFFCLLAGLLLGLTGAFLGIGGGPINLMILYLFFSMDTKTAAINSLFVIFFSQLSSLLLTLISGNVPEVNLILLAFMIAGGIFGAFTGSAISRRLSHRGVDKLFIVVLIVIILISVKNMIF